MAERAIAAQAVAGAETVERNGKVLNAGERHADTPLVESGPPTSRGRRPFRFFSSGPPGRDSTRDEGGCANRSSRRLRRSEEHTSELQSLMRISYDVFCLKKKTKSIQQSLQK